MTDPGSEHPIRVFVQDKELLFRPTQTVIIGRDPSATLHIPDNQKLVSREHARLVWRSTAWHLEDMDSFNGVWVEGHRVTDVEIDSPVAVTLGPPASGIKLVIQPEHAQGNRGLAASPDLDLSDGTEYVWRIVRSRPEWAGSFMGAVIGCSLVVGAAVAGLIVSDAMFRVMPPVVRIVFWIFGFAGLIVWPAFAAVTRRRRSHVFVSFFSALLAILLLVPLWGPDFGAEFTSEPSSGSLAGLVINTTLQALTLDGAANFGIEVASIEPLNDRGRQFVFVLKLCILLSCARLIAIGMDELRTRVVVATNRDIAMDCAYVPAGSVIRLGSVGGTSERAYSTGELGAVGRQLIQQSL